MATDQTPKQDGGTPSAGAGCSQVALTPEQVHNWRLVLCSMIGPYALVMPDADVQRIRNRLEQITGDAANAKHVRRGASEPCSG